MPRPSERRFFFVHLQKTGGISLLWRLRRVFPDPAIYPDASDGDMWADQPQMSVDRLLQRWSVRRRRAQIRLIAGHFPLATTALLGEEFTSFTILREPVARTASFLRHYRANHPQWQSRSLTDLFDDPFVNRNILRNHMTKMLGLAPDEMTAGVLTLPDLGEHHLAAACRNLEDMGLVGLTEQMEDFAAGLERRFGWDLGDPIRSNESAAQALDPGLADRIVAENDLDVRLYQFAAERWGR